MAGTPGLGWDGASPCGCGCPICLSLLISISLAPSLPLPVSISITLVSLTCLFIVHFPPTVKDLDTEKYFHLVSDWLGPWDPALWVWHWLPALGHPVKASRLGRPGQFWELQDRGHQMARDSACWVLTTAWPQVLPTDELAEPKKSHRQSHRKKVLPEIYLTRLLSTKVGPASVSPGQWSAVHEPGGESRSGQQGRVSHMAQVMPSPSRACIPGHH